MRERREGSSRSNATSTDIPIASLWTVRSRRPDVEISVTRASNRGSIPTLSYFASKSTATRTAGRRSSTVERPLLFIIPVFGSIGRLFNLPRISRVEVAGDRARQIADGEGVAPIVDEAAHRRLNIQ